MEIETRGRLRNTRRVRACVRWFVSNAAIIEWLVPSLLCD